MKINDFLKDYNFHDCRLFNICFDENNQKLKCNIEVNNLWLEKHKVFNSNILHLEFSKVVNIKSVLDITKIDDYILNFWKIKHSKNGIEIILDNDDYSTIYFYANSVEIT